MIYSNKKQDPTLTKENAIENEDEFVEDVVALESERKE